MKKRFTKTTPWAYSKGNSFLHRLPAGIKLVFLFVLSLGAFFPGLVTLPLLALALVVLSVCAGFKPWELLAGSGPLLLFVLVIFLFNALDFSWAAGGSFSLHIGIDPGGLLEGLVFALRIALCFSAGALFFRVTTRTEIKRSLEKFEAFFHLKNSADITALSLGLSLMMGFMPRFFEVWEESNLAWESRSGRLGLLRIFKLLPLVIERLMEKAADTAIALESRGILLK
ncbi:cobalt ABC transporter [Spirochaetia bacterium]|nr:cobalt ABC transporter [Spirochaetia bacterium]